MVEDRLRGSRWKLDKAIDEIRELCEPVAPPKRDIEYRNYFCARNLDNKEIVERNEPRRAALYAAVDEYVAAYTVISDELDAAGYARREIESIHKEVAHFLKLRDELRAAAGDIAE